MSIASTITPKLLTAKPSCKIIPLPDNDGNPLPWAKQVSHPAMEALPEKGRKFTGGAIRALLGAPFQPLDPATAKAYISGLHAEGKMIGDHILDSERISKSKPVPIVYPPDSGVVIAKGVAHAFERRGYRCRIIPAQPDGHGDGKSYHIASEAEAMAKKANRLILCDGIISSAKTLGSVIDSITHAPSPFTGRLVVAANSEIKPPHSPSSLILDKLQGHQSQFRQLTYLVARRGRREEVEPVKISDALTYLRDTADPQQDWGTRELLKRAAKEWENGARCQ